MAESYTEKAPDYKIPAPSNILVEASAKPHECHCAPDAPCRKSGICRCMDGLMKILENTGEKAKEPRTSVVLIGEDEEHLQRYLTRLFGTKNIKIELASTPNEVVSKARAGNYAAVVSDLNYTQEGREGYDVLKELRNLPAVKILFTSQVSQEFRDRGLECGADHVVLNKNPSELLKILETARTN